jgi:putative IMPACT (imprinted ancient) family translation regulator
MFTLGQTTSLEQVIKKSRFIAVVGPLANEQEAKRYIAAHSDPNANHNCWAWRSGQTYRFSDDGEPSGTAGKPILQAIDRLELDHSHVVVTRWFGGVLLGSGGLARPMAGPQRPVCALLPALRSYRSRKQASSSCSLTLRW